MMKTVNGQREHQVNKKLKRKPKNGPAKSKQPHQNNKQGTDEEGNPIVLSRKELLQKKYASRQCEADHEAKPGFVQ